MEIDLNTVTHYLDMFEKVRKEVGDANAAALFAEVAKSSRVKAMLAERQGLQASNGNGSATPNQLSYLKRLGVEDIPANLSKEQASALIDKAKLLSIPRRVP